MKKSMSITAAALLVLAACSDNAGPTMGSGVSLTFASDATAGGAARFSTAPPMSLAL